MKTYKTVFKTVLSMGAAVALAFAGLPGSANAQEPMPPMKGGEMMMMNQIKTQSEAQNLKPDDSIAMVCSMCKSVVVQKVSTGKGQVKFMTAGEKHLCPGCQGTITVVGTGKHATDAVTHSCSKCGGESAFCCATKPGSGATPGMEDAKK